MDKINKMSQNKQHSRNLTASEVENTYLPKQGAEPEKQRADTQVCPYSRRGKVAIRGVRRTLALSYQVFSIPALLVLWSVLPLWGLAQGSSPQKAVAPVQSGGALPDIHVEFFGVESGYTVGTQGVILLCVVRNLGTTPLPEKTLRLRCYSVTGLEYTPCDTIPILPALAPNQAVAFRWKFLPTSAKGAMVAGVLVERTSPMVSTPSVPDKSGPQAAGARIESSTPVESDFLPAQRLFLAVVPRLEASPRVVGGVIKPNLPPSAGSTEGEAWIGNDRVAVRISATEHQQPLLLLSGKDGNMWRLLATSVPLLSVRSGEEGQVPWWEQFRWKETKVSGDKDSTILTLVGTLGTRWRAEIALESLRFSSNLNGRLRLTPLKTLRCYGVQLPRLLVESADKEAINKANGSPLLLLNEEPILSPSERLAATRTEGITFGLTWPAQLPLADWKWSRLPSAGGSVATILGTQWDSEERGTVVLAGATLDFPFRLFAFSPSDTLKDATKFLLP